MTTTTTDEPVPAGRVKNHTANRSIRINDDVWNRALARADREGRAVSELVRDFVTRYADGQQDPSAELLGRDETLSHARRVVADLATFLEVCQ